MDRPQASTPTCVGDTRKGEWTGKSKKPLSPVHNPYMKPCVYILASKRNGSLYIGMTTDIRRRVEEHHAGFVQHTRKYRIQRLVYLEPHQTIEDAALRERRIKEW